MNLQELKIILEATGFPVAYSHFVESENMPVPDPPFITYLVAFDSNFKADNKVYKNIPNVQIELYTDKKDIEAENIIEEILNDNDLPFSSTETFIQSEDLFQKLYEVRLL